MRTIFVLLALALTVVLLTACGGNDERTKVEASLQNYLSTLDPQACLGSRFCPQGAYPIGAGFPQVKENSCKKIHTGDWSCVITFAHGKVASPMDVAVKGSKVDAAAPVSRVVLPPATVYEGGP